MRFIDRAKRVITGRRSAASSETIKDKDIAQTADLVRVLNKLQARIVTLEGKVPAEPTEFEIDVAPATSVYLYHGFGTAVRWFVVDWKSSTANPGLTRNSTNSTKNVLCLDCSATGTAVIRIEPSQFGLST